MRLDGRAPDDLRKIALQMGFLQNAPASCLVSFGKTRVLCSAFCEEGVPPFLAGRGEGWVTAEYGMLPGSTPSRKNRDGIKPDGRAVEIQRLIGRSLRMAVDRKALGERTIKIDCDVIDADGGTRTAAITGAWCALYQLLAGLVDSGVLQSNPVICQVAAVSCGIVDDKGILDLCYQEDVRAQTDMNIVMTSQNAFIEIQGTGEEKPFTRGQMEGLLNLAQKGMDELFPLQREALDI